MILSRVIGWTYRHALKPLLFRFDPEAVHDRFIGIGKVLGNSAIGKRLTQSFFLYQHKALEQEILGVSFNNPVGLAAGFDKNAELTDILSSVGFGYAEVGSVTSEPCAGNPKPRLWREPDKKSLRVYYGLKNDGAQRIASRLHKMQFDIPIGISIAKTNSPTTVDLHEGIADYIKAARAFADIGDYITINISCPNAFGGEPFSDPKRLEALLGEYSALDIRKPTFIKLAAVSDYDHLDEILDVGERYGIDGYICSNLKKNKGEKGGLSGKAVVNTSDDMVLYVYKKFQGKRVVIGTGGVFTAEDAYQKIKNGASLVQLITGMIYQGPQIVGEINAGLVRLLRADGYTHVSEAVGAAHVHDNQNTI